jgi:PAS domain S-box-containing protein
MIKTFNNNELRQTRTNDSPILANENDKLRSSDENDNLILADDNDDLVFADEDDKLILANEDNQTNQTLAALENNQSVINPNTTAWKVMIVDDDPTVHEVTLLALEGFNFQGKPISFISAYSSQEAKSLLKTHPDTALIFLDVVMEENDSGLQLTKYIRDTMQNQLVRIILRTGQPGEAPEESVIVDYDINDYKLKVELTHHKLFATTVAGLRNYHDLMTLELNKVALKQINKQLQTEILERQRTEEKLRLTQFSVKQAADAIFWIGSEAQILYANQAAVRSLGYSREELLSMTVHDIDPNFPPEAWPAHWKKLQQDSSLTIESQHQTQAGNIFPVEITLSYMIFNGTEYNIAFVRDITERKRVETERIRFTKALQESEERFRIIAETTPVPLFISRISDGTILYANTQSAATFGISSAENLIGSKSIDLYYNPTDRKSVLDILFREGHVYNYELQVKKLDNTPLWVALFIQQMVFKNEPVILTTIYDITERKRAEQERSRFIKELGELNATLTELNTAYERFVPREFLSLLDKESVLDIQLGDQIEKEMTLLFADIRGFTSLSEKMTPQENFNFLNAYLSRMEPVIHEHHGFIDKYIGDAIMAIFPTSANEAVQAAIGMLKQLAQYNLTRGRPGRPCFNIGIGIHTGYLMLGTVGGKNRMDGTVISDTVNLASRVEGLTKIYGTPLLITEQTYLKLTDPLQYSIRVIDAVKVKGKSEVVTVYEIYDADSPTVKTLKNQTRDDFEEGFVLYHWEEFNDACPFFERVLQVNQKDLAAQVYLKRCEHFQKYGVPKDWEGLFVL